MAQNRIPILLDTDIGGDIDDAFCLAYLLKQPGCELLGITTVSGEPDKRAMLADALCRAAGRTDIPVHSGHAEPLAVGQRQPTAHQAEVLARWPHCGEFPANTAVPFLRETIRSRPGEVTLLTIGPLTNIALLFRQDPEIPRLLKGLVMVAGAFLPNDSLQNWQDWNVLCDPHAAAAVYGAEGLSILSVGLNVTTRCVMSADTCRQRMVGGPLKMARDVLALDFGTAGGQVTFHDPLAAAAIFAPGLLRYQAGRTSVNLAHSGPGNITVWDPGAEVRSHRIATGVDVDEFFAEYFRVAALA